MEKLSDLICGNGILFCQALCEIRLPSARANIHIYTQREISTPVVVVWGFYGCWLPKTSVCGCSQLSLPMVMGTGLTVNARPFLSTGKEKQLYKTSLGPILLLLSGSVAEGEC